MDSEEVGILAGALTAIAIAATGAVKLIRAMWKPKKHAPVRSGFDRRRFNATLELQKFIDDRFEHKIRNVQQVWIRDVRQEIVLGSQILRHEFDERLRAQDSQLDAIQKSVSRIEGFIEARRQSD